MLAAWANTWRETRLPLAWYEGRVLRSARLLVSAVLVAGVIGGCASKEGKAGPLGPQPQKREASWPFTETWQTPYPTPFGTAGLSGIPPRPSYPPALHPTPLPSAGPSVSAAAVVVPAWKTSAEADAALTNYQPLPPEGAQSLVPFFDPAYGSGCSVADRAYAVDDVDSFYAESRRALLAAEFVITFEDRRPLDGRYADAVLTATSPVARAVVGAGRYDPSMWASGRKISKPYLVRVLFTQICGAR